MPKIQVYDYNNDHAVHMLPIAVCHTDLDALTGGTDSKGVEYEVSRSTSGQGFKWVYITRHSRCYSIDDVNDFMMDVFGEDIKFTNAAVVAMENNGGLFGKSELTNLAPFFSISYTEFTRNNEPWANGNFGWFNSNAWTNSGFEERRDQGFNTLAPFAVVTADHTYFGSIVTRVYGGGGSYFRIVINYSTEITTSNFGEISEDPGNKGFTPINDIIHTPRGGGEVSHKKPGYTTDTIALPGEPDESKASAIGSGFIHAYDITPEMLNNLGKVLYHPDFLSGIANFFINPLDALISLNIFPYTPHVGGSTYVKLLKYDCKSEYFGVDVTGLPLAKEFRTVSFGTVPIPEEWHSFLDYDATSASLYLPFIGEVNLDISEIMGGSVSVEYTIDFFTGMCVANVSCSRGFNLDEGFHVNSNSVHSYQGNCAINIPLGAADYGSLVGSLINAASAGLSTGLAGAVGSLMGSAATGGFKPTITTKGSIGANAGFCGVLYPYIILTRPVTAIPESYQTVKGFPSYIKTTLGECQDLCVCDEIDVTGISGATDEELDEIRQLCKDGVFV